MKILQTIAFIVIALSVLGSTPVLAHSGRTDGDGGHYDHSTGEYHYHHGYPAHQHENGECPYRFDDKTGQDSGDSGGSLKGGYSGGSNSDSDDPTVYYVLLGAAGIGLLVWFIRKKIQEKQATRSPSSEPETPTPPSPRMNPVRLVSPDPEPTESLDPKTQVVTLPIVRKPRPDPDSVLTVEDIMPPPLKKTPPSNLSAIDPNHHTFAMREVKSSNIHSIGYSNGTLTVRFLNGREYVYFDIPISVYYSFIDAPSVGKYYNEHIRQKYHGDFVGIKDNEAPKTTNPT